MENFIFQKVKLSDLAPSADFCTRWQTADDVLTASVRQLGVAVPVILTRDKPYRLISGYKRIHAARSVGLENIPALIVQRDLSDQDLFVLALVSNLQSPWTDFDRAHVIHKADAILKFKKSQIVETILPILGLGASEHVLQDYGRISKLNPALIQRLELCRLPLSVLREFSGLSSEDQKVFANQVLPQIHLTASEIKDVVMGMSDLIKNHELSLEALLVQKGFRQILENPKWDKKQKAQKLTTAFRQLRFPALGEYETKFKNLSAQICNDSTMKIEAPEFFEAQGFRIHIEARSAESLKHAIASLKSNQDLLNSLFDIKL